MYSSFILWIISISTNLISVIGIDVSQYFPYIWILHIGMIVISFPTILYAKNNPIETDQDNSFFNSGIPLIPYFKKSPTWLNTIVIAGFTYAVLSFIITKNSYIGTPEIDNGKYILSEHGQFIKNITEMEFHKLKANELIGFSGIWISFYGLEYLLLKQIVNQIETEE